MKTLCALLFDVDNTLTDRSRAFHEFCDDFCMEQWPEWSAGERQAAMKQIVSWDNRGYCPALEVGRRIAEQFGKISPADFVQAQESRLSHYFEPDAAVYTLLQRLAARFDLGVVTNGAEEQQRIKLERTALEPYFRAVVTSEATGIEKPDPRIFERIITSMGRPVSEILLIGDHPQNDMQGASRVGLCTCWVSLGRTFPPHLSPPRSIIPHVTDLEAALHKINF